MKRVEDVDWATVEFIDLGSGRGWSLASAQKRIGGRGVGIEVSEAKVREARRDGHDVVLGDLFDLPEDIRVRYVVMDNLLEHLPGKQRAREALERASRLATEFLYLRHPSFEDEAYLGALGLKQYWTDWSGHKAHVLLAELMRWFRELGVRSFVVHPVEAAWDSSHPTILPAAAPRDRTEYDPSIDGPKPDVAFVRPVYYAFDLVAVLSPEVSRVRLEYEGDPETDRRPPRLMIERELAEWLRERSAAHDAERAALAGEVGRLSRENEQLRARRAVRLADALGRLRRRLRGSGRTGAGQ